ncbi:hypothetical protein F9K85_13275 [Brucella tritici]|uniref:hypothetical protein n=1 Tax=Brucella tritici TaxID=94626 RepID=UPI00124F066A|nr:hypothetical protein [Brucella tritici]KAB2675877.1 hypothetical protein F9K85_13275 [Brucella tritici]
MASELKPCPFCGYALSIDEGICPIPDAVDEDTGEWKFTGICCPSCAVFLPKQREDTEVSEGVEAWNTRPAPAATDTGLKTIGFVPPMFVEGKGADYNDIFRSVSIAENYTAVVTRSQAEELLAAERAEKEALRRAIMGKEPAPELQHGNFLEMAATLHRACDGARKRAEYAEQRLGQSEAELKQARADNAAQAVRIKELNANTDTLMTECHRVSKESGDQFREMRGQIEALETKLAAATETAARAAYRACAETRHVSLGHAAADAVRAVLGGKPSC